MLLSPTYGAFVGPTNELPLGLLLVHIAVSISQLMIYRRQLLSIVSNARGLSLVS